MPSDVKGRAIVTRAISMVAISRYLLGVLLRNDLLVRTTRTISDAERTDSTNQVVLNKGS